MVQPFLDARLELVKTVVLTTPSINPPPRPNTDAEYRTLTTDADWEVLLEHQVLCRDANFKEEPYRLFRSRKPATYRQMVAKSMSDWFGAFVGGELVADMGVFFEGDIARYQNVSTHPDYRGHRLCGTLVHFAGTYALKNYGVKTLVMLANPDYHAAKIYEPAGFGPSEQLVQLEKRNLED